MKHRKTLQTGDWIEICKSQEIASTLDARGTLDGLPFMPEMLPFCGQRHRVLRRAEKACVEFAGGEYKIQGFVQNHLIILDTLRCSGASHDGCQRGCLVFWHPAWLRQVADGKTSKTLDPSDTNELSAKLETKTDGGRYFCQSTEMAKITQPQTRLGIIMKCIHDVQSGSRGAFEMARLVVSPIWRKVSRPFVNRSVVGTLTKTPIGKLGLQSGEEVEIKTLQEIAETLDAKGRNRGLLVDYNAICKYTGGRYKVRTRVDRMIHEATGKMCTLDNTVILDKVSCTCHSVVGGCPRQDPVFWREAWLRRVSKQGTSEAVGHSELSQSKPIG